ncbi:hypothetical protein T484DRAFT_1817441 [Baffinella frigidus]|nr:hypothetical protein T484DRAFT_1817441 [Cryptophyta sp. CCMP2293]
MTASPWGAMVGGWGGGGAAGGAGAEGERAMWSDAPAADVVPKAKREWKGTAASGRVSGPDPWAWGATPQSYIPLTIPSSMLSIPPSMRKPEYTYFEPFHIYSTPLPPSHNKPHDGFDQFGKHAKPPAAPTPAEGGKEGGGRGGGASDQTGQISEQTGQNSGDHASDLRLPSLAERSGADSSMSVGMSEGGRARGGGGGAQVDSLVQQRSIMAEWLGRGKATQHS